MKEAEAKKQKETSQQVIEAVDNEALDQIQGGAAAASTFIVNGGTVSKVRGLHSCEALSVLNH